ncbi:hypothetical protein GQ53DRAFT_794702 [Thozetella sp. PMI_491]|nr:hypothetical protein GQ53DRAFT_794702 [Thozetella sp. PMI_491]
MNPPAVSQPGAPPHSGEVPLEPGPSVSRGRTFTIIACIIYITAIGNLLAGLLTVCIPPAAAFALAYGSTLLPYGAAADVLGCRRVCLLGALLQTATAVGAGLSATFTQLIALRTAAGIAASLAAFAAMGGGQAVSFGLGLVIGGGFHNTVVLNGGVLLLAAWVLPHETDGRPLGWGALKRLRKDVDWIGALLISSSLALLSYKLAVTTALDAHTLIREPLNIGLLTVAIALLPAFSLWMRRQTRLGRPTLIPNALQTNVPFAALYATVFLVWGSLNASEQLTALYLQDIRNQSALTASLYFLPAPICGALRNAIAPMLLAGLYHVDSMALNPLGADLIYTITNLVVTSSFPASTQAPAGGILNMLAQIGKSIGLASTAIIARQMTMSGSVLSYKEALLQGYKAG